MILAARKLREHRVELLVRAKVALALGSSRLPAEPSIRDTANAGGEVIEVARLMPPSIWDPHEIALLLVARPRRCERSALELALWALEHAFGRDLVGRVECPALAPLDRSKPARRVLLRNHTATPAPANRHIQHPRRKEVLWQLVVRRRGGGHERRVQPVELAQGERVDLVFVLPHRGAARGVAIVGEPHLPAVVHIMLAPQKLAHSARPSWTDVEDRIVVHRKQRVAVPARASCPSLCGPADEEGLVGSQQTRAGEPLV